MKTPTCTDSQDQSLAEFVERHPKLFVLTGAGCSTAAGLGDYRDIRGQWKRTPPITGQVFVQDIAARKRYWVRSYVGWPAFSQAKPATAHIALRTLQAQNKLTYLVTQNVDNLHQKADHRDVVNLHGALDEVGCISCDLSISRDHFQEQLITNNSWLNTLSASYAPDGDADVELDVFDSLIVPDCPRCHGILKPRVVFFGENVPKIKVSNALSALSKADALLVAGSSLMVYSGFRFCKAAQQQNQPVVIVNHGITRADNMASLKIDGDCGERLYTLSNQ